MILTDNNIRLGDNIWRERLNSPGIYALVIRVSEPFQRTVGRLGQVRFERGFYIYIGSAMRGLGSRLNRHLELRPRKRPRWHIDYLLERAQAQEVWFHLGHDREECGAAQAVARIPGALPIPGFGASDCRCQTHLFHFTETPEPRGLLRSWRRLPREDFVQALGGGTLCDDILLPRDLKPAAIIKRENRFVASVKWGKSKLKAHVPNSGRLAEFFLPDNPVFILPSPDPERKTSHTVILARDQDVWADIDSLQANRTFHAWARNGLLPGMEGWSVVRPETAYGDSRFDFLMEHESGQRGLVEVKCVTLVKNGIALFPDSPSERGNKHLKTLARALGKGYETFFVFIIQRHDANRVWPHSVTDPVFARSLRDAVRAGVKARAYRCRITPERIEYAGRIPVEFPPAMIVRR